jgi:hypothetical protein
MKWCLDPDESGTPVAAGSARDARHAPLALRRALLQFSASAVAACIGDPDDAPTVGVVVVLVGAHSRLRGFERITHRLCLDV